MGVGRVNGVLRRRIAALVAALLTIAPASVALTWVGPAAAADYGAIPDYATLLADWNGADGVNTFTLAPAFDQNVTDAAHFEMQAGDDFTLDLNGGSLTFTTLTVIGGGGNPYIDEMPAIEVPQGATLTIDGPGTLTVTGAAGAAGIGSRSGYLAWEYDAGTVIINGGTVTANGGGAYDGNIGERFGAPGSAAATAAMAGRPSSTAGPSSRTAARAAPGSAADAVVMPARVPEAARSSSTAGPSRRMRVTGRASEVATAAEWAASPSMAARWTPPATPASGRV